MDTASKRPIFLVTGGHGFIGSHVCRRLFKDNLGHIRIVDISTSSFIPDSICHEFILGDLCDKHVCEYAVRGVHTVLHFAANMGGMGTIHSDNDPIIYDENHLMSRNLLDACVAAGVKRFFYASSACVYPDRLQNDVSKDVSLCEHDVATYPATPQGLYGLEKLNTENVLHHYAPRLDIRIARFHNVFGPGGSWKDGREKAPAAFLRKALVLKRLNDPAAFFEIWGDGTQRRSFLYIDDAVDGIIMLLKSSVREPLNIGSDRSISIDSMARIALASTGTNPDSVRFRYEKSKPIGVASRNSNNDKVSTQLGWRPTTSLEEGMRRTGMWIDQEIAKLISSSHDRTLPFNLLQSKVLGLEPTEVKFAILLPITSRGGASPDDCLLNLRRFASSLVSTTWRDMRSRRGTSYRPIIYLCIDKDDHFLLPKCGRNKPEEVLKREGVFDFFTIVNDRYPAGHVCKLWRDCARKAWNDGCDYMVLLGDDVTLKDEGWMRHVHEEFLSLATNTKAPFGFGCVAFTDTTFAGMPTFPIIHRIHMDIFNGEIVPDVFINQDGDPFLFQLYRRWNCSKLFSARISNGIGGEGDARYAKQHATEWTFDTLGTAVSTAEIWLAKNAEDVLPPKKVTLDIIIPCYRVDIPILDAILSLKPSPYCSVMFIIIIDNPFSPYISELVYKYSHRPDVRVRVNEKNLGASETRNKGMKESAAEWVHFLDDDVVPGEDIIREAEKVIRAHPKAVGFVGNALFPCADSMFKTAVHLAGVTYFWDIATKINDDVPWGVTANLIARRVKDGVIFDARYPKTGGGEDIDFCRKKRAYSLNHGRKGFMAAPNVKVTHPWWNGGKRSYWRFYMWSVGDGALVRQFPELAYTDATPNSAECLGLCGLGILISLPIWLASGEPQMLVIFLKAIVAVLLSNILHDCFRHLYRHPDRYVNMNSSLIGVLWCMSVIESSFIRMFSELGRLCGILSRGEFLSIGKRFDWFAGRMGEGPMEEEKKNNLERLMLAFIFLGLSAMY
ncbi:glycosyltransferase family 2 protein [Crucibulum laeve]|uniref:Glycosyltransferase family 2 protein n=1 Tax=Crucibulum laeve TaxID=68775 RepID=A0A5C3LS70_9AGAR|nr:glycosyltransferase family 2 protein [Crucibulum laeve]